MQCRVQDLTLRGAWNWSTGGLTFGLKMNRVISQPKKTERKLSADGLKRS